MPLSVLDPDVALILIDLQTGLAGIPAAHPVDTVVANAAKLADTFRRKGLPVVLVNVAGAAPGRTEQGGGVRQLPENWTELLPELRRQPSDKTVTKFTWGAFHDTDLSQYLGEHGVTQVVIAGISTSAGVESTARQAHERGLHVALVTDAMTDPSPEAHDNSVTHVFPRLGETGTVADVIALLP